MKKLLFFILLFTYQQHACAQSTSIGFSLGLAKDINSIIDDDSYLIDPKLFNVPISISVRHQTKRKFFLQYGIILKYYWDGWRFKGMPFWINYSDHPSFLMPVLIGINVPLWKKKVSIKPLIGYTPGLNKTYSPGFDRGTDSYDNLKIKYSSIVIPGFSRYISLFQFGAAIDFNISSKFIISLGGSYYLGTSNIARYDIVYTVNEGPEINGSTLSKGSFYNIDLAIRYSFN